MYKYRKKPVVIEAVQYWGDNLDEVLAFTGKHPKWDEWFSSFDDYAAHVASDRQAFKIITLEGVMEALPGDWIIRGVSGEHYPCKSDIFDATYESVGLPTDTKDARATDEQKDERERIGSCECCSTIIYEGDPYHSTVDGCTLCEEHAPVLSDILRQYREALADDPLNPPAELNFDDVEDMRRHIAKAEAEIEATGDRKVLHT